MLNMTVSPAGLEFTQRHEAANGPVLVAKPDIKSGLPTFGYGTTHYPSGLPVKTGDECTPDQAHTYLQHDMLTAQRAVNAVVSVTLTQDQFDALVDFTYNLGAGALRSSTLLSYLNAGRYEAAADQFTLWDKAHIDGQLVEVPGLLKRRQDERALFLA